jgi:hypothetical protein
MSAIQVLNQNQNQSNNQSINIDAHGNTNLAGGDEGEGQAEGGDSEGLEFQENADEATTDTTCTKLENFSNSAAGEKTKILSI